MNRDKIKQKFGGRCAYTGTILQDNWEVDHVCSKKKCEVLGINPEYEDNYLPAQRIVNHYKRGRDLEEFREYMKTFHERLAKLPKTTKRLQTVKRIAYMREIASLFGITETIPFEEVFYFEKFKI